jgi:hypothetical protein
MADELERVVVTSPVAAVRSETGDVISLKFDKLTGMFSDP